MRGPRVTRLVCSACLGCTFTRAHIGWLVGCVQPRRASSGVWGAGAAVRRQAKGACSPACRHASPHASWLMRVAPTVHMYLRMVRRALSVGWIQRPQVRPLLDRLCGLHPVCLPGCHPGRHVGARLQTPLDQRRGPYPAAAPPAHHHHQQGVGCVCVGGGEGRVCVWGGGGLLRRRRPIAISKVVRGGGVGGCAALHAMQMSNCAAGVAPLNP